MGTVSAPNFAEAALHGAAEEHHLPEAVLGVDVAEAEEGVVVGLREDMRHGVAVADDLDLLLGTRQGERPIVIGKRAAREVVGESEGGDREDGGGEEGPHQPPEEERHGRARSFRRLDRLGIAGH